MPQKLVGCSGIDLAKDLMPQPKVRTFKNWVEPWEKEIKNKRSTVNEAKLVQKYKDMKVFDVDLFHTKALERVTTLHSTSMN